MPADFLLQKFMGNSGNSSYLRIVPSWKRGEEADRRMVYTKSSLQSAPDEENGRNHERYRFYIGADF